MEPLEVVPRRRISNSADDTMQFFFVAPLDGVYRLVFDNSFSWFAEKVVFYRVVILSAA